MTCCLIYVITDGSMAYITCYFICYIGINRISIKILNPTHGFHNCDTPFKNKSV